MKSRFKDTIRRCLVASPPRKDKLILFSCLITAAALTFSAVSSLAGPGNAATVSPKAPVFKSLIDLDGDLLPDGFEQLAGSDTHLKDTDQDGFEDGLEFAANSDYLDPQSIPSIEPCMRVATHLKNESTIELRILFLGTLSDVEGLFFYVLYNTWIKHGQDPAYTVLKHKDLSSTILFAISQMKSKSTLQGIPLSCLVINIPRSFLNVYAPMSIGIGLKVASFPLAEVINLEVDGAGNPMRLVEGEDYGLSEGDFIYTMLGQLDEQEYNKNQVCKTTLSTVGSGDGTTTFEVTEAGCSTLLRHSCSAVECSGLIGQKHVSIDTGFILSQLD